MMRVPMINAKSATSVPARPAPVAMIHCQPPRARRQSAARRPVQLAAAAVEVRQNMYPLAASARRAKPPGRRSTVSGSPYPGAVSYTHLTLPTNREV